MAKMVILFGGAWIEFNTTGDEKLYKRNDVQRDASRDGQFLFSSVLEERKSYMQW